MGAKARGQKMACSDALWSTVYS